MSGELQISQQDGILIMAMNRPEARNAMNAAMAQEIAAALDRLDATPALRVGILTGAGGTFCSGMDLKGFLRGESPTVPERGFGGLTLRGPVKPLIAAVDGYALAGGCELAIACDLIVASEGAKFGLPEVRRGLAAGAGGLMRLPDQIPPRIAMELILTGNFIDARRAYEVGLINRIAAATALSGALALAQEIAACAPVSVRVSKQVVREYRDWPATERWTRQGPIIREAFDSPDAREGATAFAEKRKPNWTGH